LKKQGVVARCHIIIGTGETRLRQRVMNLNKLYRRNRVVPVAISPNNYCINLSNDSGYLMKMFQSYTILLIIGLISCNLPERNSEKLTTNQNTKPNEKEKDTALASIAIRDTPSKMQTNDTVLLHPSHSNKKRSKKDEERVEESVGNSNNPSYYIIPGFARNTFTRSNDNINFTRIVKNDEDRRMGCSGGGNSLSFTVKTLRDTFLYENELLKTLNFNYTIEGGIYWANGESPDKGKIKGILLSDKSWQIEINVWIKTRDIQNTEIERRIVLNEKFTQ